MWITGLDKLPEMLSAFRTWIDEILETRIPNHFHVHSLAHRNLKKSPITAVRLHH